jgi:hypothetical protein
MLCHLPRKPGVRNLRNQIAAGRVALPMNEHLAILHRADATARRRIANQEFPPTPPSALPPVQSVGIPNSELRIPNSLLRDNLQSWCALELRGGAALSAAS